MWNLPGGTSRYLPTLVKVTSFWRTFSDLQEESRKKKTKATACSGSHRSHVITKPMPQEEVGGVTTQISHNEDPKDKGPLKP